jgi:ABC-type lipoprotein export system ATPase subunit
MKEKVLDIQQLTCAYGQAKVLQLDSMQFHRGELVFILGRSGIGKSTLIETLGLMNNTIFPNPNTTLHFYPNDKANANPTPARPTGGSDIQNPKSNSPKPDIQNPKLNSPKSIALHDIWKSSNTTIAQFRNSYFSFIFQNTNLMPNFTAGENMSISQLIQGIPLDQSKERVFEMMQSLDLPPDIYYKKVYELSGGQRQRLAFVRAVTSSFEVLFGDEPTGNLDRFTSSQLMRILSDILKIQHKTAIIVSHDIDLAVQYADKILLLTPTEQPDTQRVLGIVLPENQLQKADDGTWTNKLGELIEYPESYIQSVLQQIGSLI